MHDQATASMDEIFGTSHAGRFVPAAAGRLPIERILQRVSFPGVDSFSQ
jgi:hypothetical protein